MIEKKEKKVLGGDITKLIITTCRPYFSSDATLLKELRDNGLESTKEYTIEEITKIVKNMTTNNDGKRKPVVRRYQTIDEINSREKTNKREDR